MLPAFSAVHGDRLSTPVKSRSAWIGTGRQKSAMAYRGRRCQKKWKKYGDFSIEETLLAWSAPVCRGLRSLLHTSAVVRGSPGVSRSRRLVPARPHPLRYQRPRLSKLAPPSFSGSAKCLRPDWLAILALLRLVALRPTTIVSRGYGCQHNDTGTNLPYSCFHIDRPLSTICTDCRLRADHENDASRP